MTERLIAELEAEVIRIFAEVQARREEYLRAWFAETGHPPSECVLVEHRDGETIRCWVEHRPTAVGAELVSKGP